MSTKYRPTVLILLILFSSMSELWSGCGQRTAVSFVIREVEETRPSYEKLKNPAMNEALERYLDRMVANEKHLNAILSEGKRPKLDMTGMWSIWVQSTNGSYRITFRSEAGGVSGVQFVPLVRKSESEFSIEFDKEGRPEKYSAHGTAEILEFHPNGILKHCRVKIDGMRFGDAWWEPSGHPKSEQIVGGF